jgi:hypothetical protein
MAQTLADLLDGYAISKDHTGKYIAGSLHIVAAAASGWREPIGFPIRCFGSLAAGCHLQNWPG